MISIVNKTIFSNPSLLSSGTFNLSAPSTSGNTLVVVAAILGGNSQSPPIILRTNNSQSFITGLGVFESNLTSCFLFYLLPASATTSISFSAQAGDPFAIPAMIVYEISGNSLSYGGNSIGVTCKFTSVSSYTFPGFNSFTENSVCFLASISPRTISSVVPAPTETDNVPPISGQDASTISDIYLNVSSSPNPVFSLSPSGSICVPGICFNETSSGPTSTTTALSSNLNPSLLGQLVTFTATVNGPGGPGSPTETVTFNIDGSNVATVSVSAVSSGVSQAQYSTASLTVGTHPVFVVYSGDTNYSASTSPTIQQVVNLPTPTPPSSTPKNDFGNSTADVIWWHTGFTGFDEETLGNEGLINTGGTPNIPWLLGLSVSMGNAMTEAIAKQAVIYQEPEYGWDGGGGGNEAGDSQIGAGGSSNGLIVSW